MVRLVSARPVVAPYGAVGFGAPGGERVDRRLWRKKGDERVAAVEKIEDQRKPEDFFGYRNRIVPYGAGLGLDHRRVKRFFSQLRMPCFFSLPISVERPLRSTSR